MTSDRERKRRQRDRERRGEIVLPVPVLEVELPEALVAAGFLSPRDTDDRAKFCKATAHFLRSFALGVTRDDIDF